MGRIRLYSLTGLLCVGLVGLYSSLPGGKLNYLSGQGYYQGELLAGRIPVEQAIEQGTFSDSQLERIAMVPRIKEFGSEIGLASSENYSTINPTFNHVIWNVSACEPLSFEPQTWWFPIVGRVPYLGFFQRRDADTEVARLQDSGLDVYLREAGAYSTLGWFQDPLLPGMLDWSEYQLANTLLHELAHATLWIPGSVQFNESFANFVGDEASIRYIVATYGEDSEEARSIERRLDDRFRYRAIRHQLYLNLDAVYTDPTLSDHEKLRLKHGIFESVPRRIRNGGFHHAEKYLEIAQPDGWNNARLMQFRTYNRSRAWFQTVLDRHDGDLEEFMSAIERIASQADDPFEALAHDVGESYEP